MIIRPFAALLVPFALWGCASATKHHESLPSTQERQMTVGTVQKEIRQGMAQTAVAEVMGAPNIVSSDGPGREAWIYDKVSTETAYSTSSGGVQALVLGWSGSMVGGVSPGYEAGSGATSRTQRTLTVIIKFREGKVYDFSYHSSKF